MDASRHWTYKCRHILLREMRLVQTEKSAHSPIHLGGKRISEQGAFTGSRNANHHRSPTKR
jgi:hypothetical protein